MEYQEHLRREILQIIVEDMPKRFWVDIEAQARWVYEESYDSNVNDTRIRPTQVRFKIMFDRFFLFESAMTHVAEECGVVAHPQEIEINSWLYTLLRAGRLSATAKYVHSPRDMASPSAFRKQLAAANDFDRSPRLPFEPLPTSRHDTLVNGIMVHGPQSRDFREAGFRHIGFLSFAVPWKDYSGWVARFGVPEILAAYESEPERRPEPRPVWRKDRKPDEGAAG